VDAESQFDLLACCSICEACSSTRGRSFFPTNRVSGNLINGCVEIYYIGANRSADVRDGERPRKPMGAFSITRQVLSFMPSPERASGSSPKTSGALSGLGAAADRIGNSTESRSLLFQIMPSKGSVGSGHAMIPKRFAQIDAVFVLTVVGNPTGV